MFRSGVLRSPDDEVAAVEQSRFEFRPFYNDEGEPITVSGRQGNDRFVALDEILQQLASRGGLGGPSLLEKGLPT